MSATDSKETALSAKQHGTLSVVATPIGNLGDLSQRAIDTLQHVDCILAEDTRHSKRLLTHYGINTRLRSCHEHNESEQLAWAANKLDQGHNLALISDAGTPLISDPGFVLIRGLRDLGASIVAVPGPSSIIAALSIAGLPTDRFAYEGFLPSKTSAREAALKQLVEITATIVLLESSHRITACLESIVRVFGVARQLVLARELTKRFETVISGDAATVLSVLQQDSDQTRGEFVVMISGAAPQDESDGVQLSLRGVLSELVSELPVKQAATLAAKITGARKNDAYKMAQQIKDNEDT